MILGRGSSRCVALAVMVVNDMGDVVPDSKTRLKSLGASMIGLLLGQDQGKQAEGLAQHAIKRHG